MLDKLRGLNGTDFTKQYIDDQVSGHKDAVERAVALGSGPTLDAGDIWLSSLEVNGPAPLLQQAPVYKPVSLEEVEKEHILQTLQVNRSVHAQLRHRSRRKGPI